MVATIFEDALRQPAGLRSEAAIHELVRRNGPNHGPLFRNLFRVYRATGDCDG